MADENQDQGQVRPAAGKAPVHVDLNAMYGEMEDRLMDGLAASVRAMAEKNPASPGEATEPAPTDKPLPDALDVARKRLDERRGK